MSRPSPAKRSEWKRSTASDIWGGQSESVVLPLLAAFRQEMHRLGYVEGRNLMLVARFAEGKIDRFPSLAQELAHINPDVLFVATTVGTRAAKAATATIPIVFVEVGDPVGVGLVPNLARPGGNITGITGTAVELTGKPRWTPEDRPVVDGSNPASGRAPRARVFYSVRS